MSILRLKRICLTATFYDPELRLWEDILFICSSLSQLISRYLLTFFSFKSSETHMYIQRQELGFLRSSRFISRHKQKTFGTCFFSNLGAFGILQEIKSLLEPIDLLETLQNLALTKSQNPNLFENFCITPNSLKHQKIWILIRLFSLF